MRDPGPYLAAAALAATVGAGMVLRGWAVVLAVAGCVAAFVASGAEALSWLWLVLILPILVAATVVGWIAGRVLPRRARLAPVAIVAVMLLVAGIGTAHRASLDHVPSRVAATLPQGTTSLGLLCFGDLPAADRRATEREIHALAREVRRRPDALVRVTYKLADSPGDDHQDLTVHELADENLKHIRCDSQPARELRAALG